MSVPNIDDLTPSVVTNVGRVTHLVTLSSKIDFIRKRFLSFRAVDASEVVLVGEVISERVVSCSSPPISDISYRKNKLLPPVSGASIVLVSISTDGVNDGTSRNLVYADAMILREVKPSIGSITGGTPLTIIGLGFTP